MEESSVSIGPKSLEDKQPGGEEMNGAAGELERNVPKLVTEPKYLH